MKKCKIIIGKNFGDEGKGKLTDFWAKKLTEDGERVLVIKNNGGAQAGHTVEEGNFRFVFHQLGSGSYRGCPTFLGECFSPDLLKLSEEVKNFEAAAGFPAPPLFVSGDCIFTTPFDVLLNSLLESLRGNDRHGSCGMGIFETRRRKEKGYGCTVGKLALMGMAEIEDMLFGMREEYVRNRLMEIFTQNGITEQSLPEEAAEWLSLLMDDNIVRNSARIFWRTVREEMNVLPAGKEDAAEERTADFLKEFDALLFENAQGLLLDEDNQDYFPHLTPSHTGLFNVRDFCRRYGLEQFAKQAEVCYVTRTYVTRHGRGRLDYECDKAEINGRMTDLTNVPNPWQDQLRYAYHPSGGEFWRAVSKDLALWQGEIRKSLYVTHLDETREQMMFWDGTVSFADFCRQYGNDGFEIERLEHRL